MIIDWYYHLEIHVLLATRPAVFFNRLNQLEWYKNTLQKWVNERKFLSGSEILEVGCATGVLSRHIADSSCKVTGVDLSESMTRIAKTQYPELAFQVADAAQLPFAHNTFDAVISASLINIVSEQEKVMQEMQRVCKQGGVISVLVPLKGFDNQGLNTLIAALQLRGFSAAALRTWHKRAPKMTFAELEALFAQCKLEIQQTDTLLGGMVVAVTAIHQ